MNELDCCILGVIWRDAPISAYGVRNEFARSRTEAWSSSTGTIYPAIRRLREARLVSAEARQGPRNSELLHVTPAGVELLRRWLRSVDDWGGPNADPLRTRVHFLTALSKPDRKAALAKYRDVTASSLRAIREDEALAKQSKDFTRAEYLGKVGCRYQLEARLAWLDWVSKELER